ncbi:MAG: bacterial/archaeal transporter family protein [Chthoniobacter sp.]|jgi:transporter family protein|nr:bacterial/archaeal transporter family protein [Chthoniobacter sp.]
MWWFYATLSAVFAALTALLAKLGIKGVDSNLATAIRTVVILVLAWGIVFYQGTHHNLAKISRFSLWFLIASGVATGLSWLFYFKALQLGDVVRVGPIDKASLGLATLLAVLFLGEQLTWQIALGTALVILGAIIVALSPSA